MHIALLLPTETRPIQKRVGKALHELLVERLCDHFPHALESDRNHPLESPSGHLFEVGVRNAHALHQLSFAFLKLLTCNEAVEDTWGGLE